MLPANSGVSIPSDEAEKLGDFPLTPEAQRGFNILPLP